MYFKSYPSVTALNSALTEAEKYVVWVLLKYRKKMVLCAEVTHDPALNPVQIYGMGRKAALIVEVLIFNPLHHNCL